MNATAAIGLACLALASACPVQASDETYYIYHQHLAMMEREAALFSPVEEWVVRFLRDRIVADELPGEYSCSLYYGVDKWTAAEILLNLTLDDDDDELFDITITKSGGEITSVSGTCEGEDLTDDQEAHPILIYQVVLDDREAKANP